MFPNLNSDKVQKFQVSRNLCLKSATLIFLFGGLIPAPVRYCVGLARLKPLSNPHIYTGLACCRFFLAGALFGPFQRCLLALQALRADAMRGGRVKSLLHEILQLHPFALVINAPAPGAHPHEILQLPDPFQQPVRRTAHQQPDGQEKQHLQRGPAIQAHEWVIGENQRRQLDQVVKVTDCDDGEKTEVLVEDHFRQMKIQFHTNYFFTPPRSVEFRF